MARWDVWGLVIGEVLPDDWLTIEGVLEIHPGDEDEVQSLRDQRIDVPVDLQPPDPFHFDVTRAPVHVQSRWIFRFEVDAEDEDNAFELARETVPLYSSVLDSLNPDGRKPFHLEVLSVSNPASGHVSAIPAQWNVYPVRVRTIEEGEIALLKDRLALVSGNDGPSGQAARAATVLLRDATYLADTAMEVELLENASLLLYFQIIEGIAQYVARRRERGEQHSVNEERASIGRRLLETLESASPEEVSRLIHSADYELRQAEESHLRTRLMNAGHQLGLDEHIIEEAVDFLRLRSSRLAHFGESLGQDRIRWFHQRNGRRVAVFYLAAFMDWLIAEDVAQDSST